MNDELLTMTWPSEGAARQYLKRRGTTARAAGCRIVPAEPSGFRLERKAARGRRPRKPQEPDVLPSVDPAPPSLATGLPHTEWAQVPYRLDDGGYEAWAIAVDDVLDAAGEEPERESDLQALFRAGAVAASAADYIVDCRAAKLGGDPVLSWDMWLAAELVEVVTQEAAEVTPEAWKFLVRQPAEPLPSDDAANSPREIESPRSEIEAGAAISSAAISPTESVRQFFLRLAEPVDQQTAESIGPGLAKQVGAELLLVDQRTNMIATRFLPQTPRSNRLRPPVTAPWPRIVPLLERQGGATSAVLKTALGWKQAPARTLLRQWAAAAGRALVEATVGGTRCYSLAAPERR